MLEGQGAAAILVSVAAIVSAGFDIRSRLIPNRLTYSLFLVGALLSVIDGRVFHAVLALGLCLILLLPLYLVGILGGGDLKLLAAVSLFGDWLAIADSLVLVVLFGALISLFYLGLGAATHWLPGQKTEPEPDGTEVRSQTLEHGIPLACPIAAAVICVQLLGFRVWY